MKIFIKWAVFLLFIYQLFLAPVPLSAEESNQFITIVNPVRISSYTTDPKASLQAQYFEINKRNLPATWLLTYDAIKSAGIVPIIKSMDKKQDVGVFMEVTPSLAQEAGVIYNKTDSWHRANSLFLSGYPQDDRFKLIDTIFKIFKDEFGYYPSSVGSWWTDSFSLQYMKDKYGIVANLGCSDQFSTDGYHIWGQYWSMPFYPSKYHAGIPARSIDNKLDIVTIQWAPRDPLNGYGEGRESAYSTQDYFTLGLTEDYFEKLIDLYAKKQNNTFGQITVGLEGDFPAEVYQGNFAKQMETISRKVNQGGFKTTTMKDFATWYQRVFPKLSPAMAVVTDDLLGKKIKVVWYQSPSYRIGLVYNHDTKETNLIDLRTYFADFQEPYYLSPNKQIDLFINIPSIIDKVNNPASAWKVTNEEMASFDQGGEELILNYGNNRKIKLTKDQIYLENFPDNLMPYFIRNSPMLIFNKLVDQLVITPREKFLFPPEGLIFQDLSIQATYFLWRPKVRYGLWGAAIAIALTIVFILKFKGKNRTKFFLISLLVGGILIGISIWKITNSQKYLVNQAEIDALLHLSVLPPGKVVVYKNGCLICPWHTLYPPPAFANKKDYIGKLANKPLVYNSTIFTAKTRADGRKELKKLQAKYIYLVKFEDYIESMPFSPGDYNVEKIYENANAEIW